MLVEILLMFQVFKAGEDICYMRETLVADKIITEKMLLKKEEDNNRDKFVFLLKKKKKKKDPIIPFSFPLSPLCSHLRAEATTVWL